MALRGVGSTAWRLPASLSVSRPLPKADLGPTLRPDPSSDHVCKDPVFQSGHVRSAEDSTWLSGPRTPSTSPVPGLSGLHASPLGEIDGAEAALWFSLPGHSDTERPCPALKQPAVHFCPVSSREPARPGREVRVRGERSERVQAPTSVPNPHIRNRRQADFRPTTPCHYRPTACMDPAGPRLVKERACEQGPHGDASQGALVLGSVTAALGAPCALNPRLRAALE